MSHKHVIADIIDYLVAHYEDKPSLDVLARRAGYEPTHFQKLFKDYVGISPKRLCQYMSMKRARGMLEDGQATLDVALDNGLSGNGRLHDLFVACEGVTPGNIQRKGQGLAITYGFYQTIIGEVMIAKTPIGVCWLGFLMDGTHDEGVARLKKRWPLATHVHDDAAVFEEGESIMRIWRGQPDASRRLKLDLYGTNFQLQVWQALLQIPSGETVTYMDIAQDLGRPKANRAVGNAVGANPISVLIPCHRVIRATGIIDNYAWGSARKKLLLSLEGSL